MIRAIIRPDKINAIADALTDKDLPALTKMHVFGRGKQKGIQIGEVVYDELPKTAIMLVVDDKDLDKAVKTIMDAGRTGNIGDGKLFVTPVEEAYTIRTGEPVL